MTWLLVGLGGALGSMARHGLNHVIHQRYLSSTFPLGIFLINILGSIAIEPGKTAGTDEYCGVEKVSNMFPRSSSRFSERGTRRRGPGGLRLRSPQLPPPRSSVR